MKRALKMLGITIAILLIFIIVVVILFLNFSPQFGKPLTKEQKLEYSEFDNFHDGKFQNINSSPMNIKFGKMMKEYANKSPNTAPKSSIDVDKIDTLLINNNDTDITQLFWFGHSTFLLEMDKKIILIDPMFGKKPSPVPFLGTERYSDELPISIDELPQIDAVILSHDHYDHLDYGSIKKLKDKVARFYTPLGVGNHLRSWGVAKDKIFELNWADSIDFEGIQLVCAPSRHFSGRGMFDRESTLWCSWVIKGQKHNIYFSGDSGYDTHFKDIGNKYGPFDISLIECGQYNEQWKYNHMTPEESIMASVDLKSNLMMPIHWGAFTLAFHDWTDPIERSIKKANELNVSVVTPRIGEPIILGNENYPQEKWWREHQVNK